MGGNLALSDFRSKESWGNIERGTEFEAAFMFPSDSKDPFRFYSGKIESSKGRLVNKDGDFSPRLIDGRLRAQVQQIVVSLKPRRVVVISSDDINQNDEFEYILVAPINTIKEQERNKDWYSILKDDEHPIYTYIPNEKFERYVDLSQTASIHKSLLLKKYNKVDQERWCVLEENLLHCLSLGIFEGDAPGD